MDKFYGIGRVHELIPTFPILLRGNVGINSWTLHILVISFWINFVLRLRVTGDYFVLVVIYVMPRYIGAVPVIYLNDNMMYFKFKLIFVIILKSFHLSKLYFRSYRTLVREEIVVFNLTSNRTSQPVHLSNKLKWNFSSSSSFSYSSSSNWVEIEEKLSNLIVLRNKYFWIC